MIQTTARGALILSFLLRCFSLYILVGVPNQSRQSRNLLFAAVLRCTVSVCTTRNGTKHETYPVLLRIVHAWRALTEPEVCRLGPELSYIQSVWADHMSWSRMRVLEEDDDLLDIGLDLDIFLFFAG